MRWKFIFYKVNRLVGMYNSINYEERMHLGNEIFSVFLQSMEFHPMIVNHNTSVEKMHYRPKQKDYMNEVDMKNAEDLLLIAVELYYEAKIFDWTVLNPVNFAMITMLEFGLKYYEGSERIRHWLMKLYTKLGMVSLAMAQTNKFKFKEREDDVNHIKLCV